MSVIDSASNGATEIPGTSHDSLMVFLGSPIRHWWKKGVWGSPEHLEFTEFRNHVRATLGGEFLVYLPHNALYGPWNEELGQQINNNALGLCHVLVWLCVPGINQAGTLAEVAHAKSLGIPTLPLLINERRHAALAGVVQQLRWLDATRRLNRQLART